MKPQSIPSLTGLRFIAALMVFLSHFPFPINSTSIHTLCLSGYSGVTFFFVLSGFVIYYNHLNDFTVFKLRNSWNYFIARVARIYPLYLFIILLFWLKGGGIINLTPYLLGIQAWSKDLAIAWGIDAPAWSISVELFLYTLFPFLAYLVTKTKILSSPIKIISALITVSSIMFFLALYFQFSGKAALDWSNPSSAHRWLYIMPLTRSLDFMLGMIAASIYLRYSGKLKLYNHLWSLLSYLSLLAVLLIMSCSQVFYSAFSWDVVYAIPFFVLILSLSLNNQSWLSKILAYSPMIALGEASYGFYLIHYYAMSQLKIGFNSTPLISVLFYLFSLLFVIVIAYGLHRAIEVPARRFLRNLLTVNTEKTKKFETGPSFIAENV